MNKPLRPILSWSFWLVFVFIFAILFGILTYIDVLLFPNTFADFATTFYFMWTIIVLVIGFGVVFLVMKGLLAISRLRHRLRHQPSPRFVIVDTLPEILSEVKPTPSSSVIHAEALPEQQVQEPELVSRVVEASPEASEIQRVESTGNTAAVQEIPDNSFAQAATLYDRYMARQGYVGQEGNHFFSLMTMARLLVVPGIDHASTIVSLTSGFFAGDSVIFDLTMLGDTPLDQHPNFANVLKSAIASPTQPHVIQILHANPNKLNQFFGSLREYLRFPHHEYTLTLEGTTYIIPSNLWFITTLRTEAMVFDLPEPLLTLSAVFDPVFERVETKREDVMNVNAYQFDITKAMRVLSPTLDSKRLPEELWKKVDQWIQFMNGLHRFEVRNEVALRFENYLITRFTMEEDGLLILDQALSSSLLVYALVGSPGSKYQQQYDVSHFFESTFGRNSLKRSRAMVKQYAGRSN